MNDTEFESELRSQLRTDVVAHDDEQARHMTDTAMGTATAGATAAQPITIPVRPAHPHRTGRRRFTRYLVPATAAAAVIAVTAVSLGLASTYRHAGRTTSAAASKPAKLSVKPADLTWTARVDTSSGITIKSSRLESDNVTFNVRGKLGAGSWADGSVTVWAAGALPAIYRFAGTAMTVHGHEAHFGVTSLNPPSDDSNLPALVWEYAPDAWAVAEGIWGIKPAVVQGEVSRFDLSVARPALQRLADATDTSTAAPVLLDFTVGWLPAGLATDGASVYEGVPAKFSESVSSVSIGFRDGRPTASDSKGDRALSISRSVGRISPSKSDSNLRVGGMPAYYGSHSVVIPEPQTWGVEVSGGWADGGAGSVELDVLYPDGTELTVRVDALHRAAYSKVDMIKIAESVSFAPEVSDRGTWVPATQAIPHK